MFHFLSLPYLAQCKECTKEPRKKYINTACILSWDIFRKLKWFSCKLAWMVWIIHQNCQWSDTVHDKNFSRCWQWASNLPYLQMSLSLFDFSLFIEQCHLLLFCCRGSPFTGIQSMGTSSRKEMRALSIPRHFQGRKIRSDGFRGFHAELWKWKYLDMGSATLGQNNQHHLQRSAHPKNQTPFSTKCKT